MTTRITNHPNSNPFSSPDSVVTEADDGTQTGTGVANDPDASREAALQDLSEKQEEARSDDE